MRATASHKWFGATLLVAWAVLTGTATAQIAPRYVVVADEVRTYRDVDGDVACRTDRLSTTCISRSLERLTCEAAGCDLNPAGEGDWLALRQASANFYVHPHTEVWSSAYGGSGCTAQEGGGFICQSSGGSRKGIPEVNRTRVEGEAWARHLVGEWSSNCENGDAVSYFGNGTLEGDRRAGRWRFEGDVLIETYIVQADPADAGETDMRFTRRSRLVLNDDGSILKRGEWLSGGDVPPDALLVRCDGTSRSTDLE